MLRSKPKEANLSTAAPSSSVRRMTCDPGGAPPPPPPPCCCAAASMAATGSWPPPPMPPTSAIIWRNASGCSWIAWAIWGCDCWRTGRSWANIWGCCAIMAASWVNCGLFLISASSGGMATARRPPPDGGAPPAAGGVPPAAGGGAAFSRRIASGMPLIKYSTARSGFPKAAARHFSTSGRSKPMSQSCAMAASAPSPVTEVAAAWSAATPPASAAGVAAGAGVGSAAGVGAAGGLALVTMTTTNSPGLMPIDSTVSSSFKILPEWISF
mmetsp:Transcript_66608/g.216763  ORF Transcript_66608/g.216763 Transcript_66608/m.216763 type:complete len:269 (+) Transcript_66608:291-1097(+)